jgi:hypothetical protein
MPSLSLFLNWFQEGRSSLQAFFKFASLFFNHLQSNSSQILLFSPLSSGSRVKPATKGSCFFPPVMNSIPGDSLYTSYSRFVQALDAERGDLIESRATVLEPMVGCAGIRAECLSASPASVATTLSPLGFVESVANDVSGSGFSRQ